MAQRHIIHVDMDAFFASVEILDNPELKGKPVVVGGSPDGRGVVAAASYEARKFGVYSAMPMSRAIRQCPNLVIIKGRMKRYSEASEAIFAIFEKFSVLVEGISIDEAFLDVTAGVRVWGSVEEIGREIKRQIKAETGLTASVGIAPNKFLAKIASDLDKPDGFVVITEENKQQVLDGLEVKKIWGVGKVANSKLNEIGIRTIAQLRQMEIEHLKLAVGNFAEELKLLAEGIDDRPVEIGRQIKSVSAEKTFLEDIGDYEQILGVLLGQVDEVAGRLRGNFVEGRTITLKIRYGDFRTITRSRTLDESTDVTDTLWRAAKAVFDEWYKSRRGKLRLIGFGVSQLNAAGKGQKGLFGEQDEKKHKDIDKAVDEIKRRFGKGAIKRKL